MNVDTQPLRIGLIGAGRVSRAHVNRMKKSLGAAELAAVADLREDAARERAADGGLGDDAVYSDPKRMIREAPIDAVSICTTHASHAELAVAAAEAGKHVLVEKPMANTLDECRDMIAAAEKSGVTLMVSQNQRFMDDRVAAKAIIDDGALGEVHGGTAYWHQNIVRMRGDDPKDNWLLDGKATGGGVLIALGVHQIDTLRFWLGDVRRVYAVNRVCDPRFVNDAEDYAFVTLTFDSGVAVQLANSYSLFAWPKDQPDQGYFVSGRNGVIVNDKVALEAPAQGIAADFRPTVDIAKARGLPQIDDPMCTNLMYHFARCCREGKPPVSGGRNNLGTMKAVRAIYQSAAEGRAVNLADLDAPGDAKL